MCFIAGIVWPRAGVPGSGHLPGKDRLLSSGVSLCLVCCRASRGLTVALGPCPVAPVPAEVLQAILGRAVPEQLAQVCELFPLRALSLLSSVQQPMETLSSCLRPLAWRNQPSCSPWHLQLQSCEKYRLAALGSWLVVPLGVSRVKRLLVLEWGRQAASPGTCTPLSSSLSPRGPGCISSLSGGFGFLSFEGNGVLE